MAQARGGVQVNVTPSGVTVSTRYTPLVKGRGTTVFKAAFDCAQNLYAALERHPLQCKLCPDVLKALNEYDIHTENLLL
ncbi:MAG: hypothetical protein ACYDH4_10810 [Candidatus Cryosericum sp.]